MLKKVRQKLDSANIHPGFIKYLNNTSWLLFGKILQMIISLFVGIWVARYLGPAKYGLLSYAIAFVSLFSAISSLGLDGIVVREMVKTPQRRDELLGTAFFLKGIGAIIMLGAILITVQLMDNTGFTNLLIFIIASSFILQSFQVTKLSFQATVQSKYAVQAEVIQMIFSAFAKLVLIWIAAPLLWFAIMSLTDAIFLTGGYLWNYARNIGKLSYWKPKKTVAISLLKDSWPLILSGMAIMFYMRIDQVMIKAMMGVKDVGYYAVAVRLSSMWNFLPMAIASSFFPAIINAKKINKELYYSRLQRLYDLMVWMAIAIALPITIFAPWIINVLYGRVYSPAAGVLTIYIWAGVFIFLGVASSNWFIAENLQKYTFYRTITGAIINVILNFILIPIYSIYGAAVATLISQFVASYFFNITNKKLRHTFILQTNAILLPLRRFGIKFY